MFLVISLLTYLLMSTRQTLGDDRELAVSLIDNETTKSVNCETTKGNIELEIYPAWSPLGAKHFLELVSDGYFQDIALYRCVRKFLTQFGITDNSKYKHWDRQEIKDDPNLNLGIKKYYLSYAGGGPHTRSTQVFIALENLDFLGKNPWETPFGTVVKGHDVVESWYSGYGDMLQFNEHGPDQQMIYTKGNQYLRENFPKMDYIIRCSVVPPHSEIQSDPNEALTVVAKKDFMIIEEGINTTAHDLEHNGKPEEIKQGDNENVRSSVGQLKVEKSAGEKSDKNSGLIITNENEVVAATRSFLTAVDTETKNDKTITDTHVNEAVIKLDAENLGNAPKIKVREKDMEFERDNKEVNRNSKNADFESESESKDSVVTIEKVDEHNQGKTAEVEGDNNDSKVAAENKIELNKSENSEAVSDAEAEAENTDSEEAAENGNKRNQGEYIEAKSDNKDSEEATENQNERIDSESAEAKRRDSVEATDNENERTRDEMTETESADKDSVDATDIESQRNESESAESESEDRDVEETIENQNERIKSEFVETASEDKDSIEATNNENESNQSGSAESETEDRDSEEAIENQNERIKSEFVDTASENTSSLGAIDSENESNQSNESEFAETEQVGKDSEEAIENQNERNHSESAGTYSGKKDSEERTENENERNENEFVEIESEDRDSEERTENENERNESEFVETESEDRDSEERTENEYERNESEFVTESEDRDSEERAENEYERNESEFVETESEERDSEERAENENERNESEFVETESEERDSEERAENENERNESEFVETESEERDSEERAENENENNESEFVETESEDIEARDQLEWQAKEMSILIAQNRAEQERLVRQSITKGSELDPMDSLYHRGESKFQLHVQEMRDHEEVVGDALVIEEREAPIDVSLDSLQQDSKVEDPNSSLRENNFILQLQQEFEDKVNKAPILVKNNLRGVGEIIYKESVLFSNHFIAPTLLFIASVFACFLYLLHVDRKKFAHAKAR